MCWCALSSHALSLSLCLFMSVPVFPSVPFCAQPLSSLHRLRSAPPIAAYWLMCYNRQTQLTGIPYLQQEQCPPTPHVSPFLSLSLPLSQLLPTAEQPANAAAAWDLSSTLPLCVFIIPICVCLTIHEKPKMSLLNETKEKKQEEQR